MRTLRNSCAAVSSFNRPIVALARSVERQSIAMFSALQPSPPTRSIVRLASSTAFTRPAAASASAAAAKATDLIFLVETGQGPFDDAVKRRDFCRLGKAQQVNAVQHAATVRRTLWPRASLHYPD